jgi:hypothetical protein
MALGSVSRRTKEQQQKRNSLQDLSPIAQPQRTIYAEVSTYILVLMCQFEFLIGEYFLEDQVRAWRAG